MIGTGAAKTLLGGAVVVIKTARDAANHAGWWLRYQAGGTAHDGDGPPPRRSPEPDRGT